MQLEEPVSGGSGIGTKITHDQSYFLHTPIMYVQGFPDFHGQVDFRPSIVCGQTLFADNRLKKHKQIANTITPLRSYA
jgi:hypothetical protein